MTELKLFKVDHLNVGVAQAYLNQKRLDQEAKNLNTNANNFNKQTQQWLTLIENFTSSLKVSSGTDDDDSERVMRGMICCRL